MHSRQHPFAWLHAAAPTCPVLHTWSRTRSGCRSNGDFLRGYRYAQGTSRSGNRRSCRRQQRQDRRPRTEVHAEFCNVLCASEGGSLWRNRQAWRPDCPAFFGRFFSFGPRATPGLLHRCIDYGHSCRNASLMAAVGCYVSAVVWHSLDSSRLLLAASNSLTLQFGDCWGVVGRAEVVEQRAPRNRRIFQRQKTETLTAKSPFSRPEMPSCSSSIENLITERSPCARRCNERTHCKRWGTSHRFSVVAVSAFIHRVATKPKETFDANEC